MGRGGSPADLCQGTQSLSAGHFLGPLIFSGILAKARFFPFSLFIVSVFPRAWGVRTPVCAGTYSLWSSAVNSSQLHRSLRKEGGLSDGSWGAKCWLLLPSPSVAASSTFTEDLLSPKEVGVATITWTFFSFSWRGGCLKLPPATTRGLVPGAPVPNLHLAFASEWPSLSSPSVRLKSHLSS